MIKKKTSFLKKMFKNLNIKNDKPQKMSGKAVFRGGGLTLLGVYSFRFPQS